MIHEARKQTLQLMTDLVEDTYFAQAVSRLPLPLRVIVGLLIAVSGTVFWLMVYVPLVLLDRFRRIE